MPFPKELPVPTYARGAMPVGTPVRVFEPYKAPAFSTPAVLIGHVVTNVTLQSTASMDQVNVPFTFGHVFKKGELGPDCTLVGAIAGMPDLPLQVNVKATHSDGSVRHAIISGMLPSLPAGASVVMGLKRATMPGMAPLGTPLPKALPSAVVTIAGVAYTAAPKATDAAMVWLSGPVANDYVLNVQFVDANGTVHPTLTAQFSVRAYDGGAVRVDTAIEHCKAYQSTTDITYDVTLSANGTTVYSQTGLVHTPCARWHKQFWYGAAPSLHIKHDTAYLIASRAVPNYDQTVRIPESVLAGYAMQLASGAFAPMQFGVFQPAMGATGGRPEIGLMPDTYAAALLSMDKRAKDMMLASADAAGSWPAHRRDDGTGPGKGMPLSVLNYPYASVLGNTGDCNNPATGKNEHLPSLTSATKGQPDTSHQAAFAYLPYLLTGDYYYLEELHFWASFNNYVNNCAYRQYEKALVATDQVRGQGWTLRTLAECATITPDDHPSKQSFVYWYESNMAWFNATYTDGPSAVAADVKYFNQLGFLANGYALGYPINNVANTGMAPWMDDFFVQSLGHGIELLGYDSVKRLMKWKSQFQIGRLTAPGVCYSDAVIYALGVRPNSQDGTPFFTTLADCYKFTLPAAVSAAACGTQDRYTAMAANGMGSFKVGDLTGYPATTEGYPSNLQPALAMAVDSGYVGGLDAWRLFDGRTTKPNYGTGAQFAIVPRLITEVAATPAAVPTSTPDPMPAPAPAPVPEPAPTPAPQPVPIVTVRYQEAKLDDVMAAYATSLPVPAGETLSESQWFVDQAKGTVIIKTTTTKP